MASGDGLEQVSLGAVSIPAGIDVPELERSLRRPRSLFSFLLTTLTTTLTLGALVPLFAVVGMLAWHGGKRLSLEVFTRLPPTILQETGGGFGNAILGTLVVVVVATLLSLPIGILGAVYLAEVGPQTRLASAVRFSCKLLTGFPSILAGIFAYQAIVIFVGYSSIAGGVALGVLMLPVILLTAEDAIRMVPARMREAAIGMGCTQSEVTWYVLLPTALPGILTGVMLAVARAAGETAPLLFTILFSGRWMLTAHDMFLNQIASLAVLIYNYSGSPSDNQQELAWAAALVLVLLVLAFNLVGQIFSSRTVRD